MSLPVSELERLRSCLTRLLPHLSLHEVALTGGIAIEMRFAERGLDGGRRFIADVDLVAERQTAIAPSVVDEFLISHYHVPHPGSPKFLVQLIDPGACMRIDIFPDLAGLIENAKPIPILDGRLRVLALSSILEHKIQTLSKASETSPVDRKHYMDALALAKLCGRDVPPVPETGLGKDDYCTDLTVRCRRCAASHDPAFPLAGKQQIFDLLGYV